MKGKYTIDKNNDPTAYISNSDAIIDLEDAYKKFATLYLDYIDSETCSISREVAQEFCDKVSQKDFKKEVVEKSIKVNDNKNWINLL